MTEPFDGIEPNPPGVLRQSHSNRGTRLVYGIVLLCVTAAAALGVLEAFGIEIWPRHEGAWRRVTYKIHPNGAGSSDVFYTRIDKADAERLGDYLSKHGYFDAPHPVHVYLTRQDGELHVSFFRDPKQAVTPNMLDELRAFRLELSNNVFGNAPLTLNYCDPLMTGNMLDPQLIVHASFK